MLFEKKVVIVTGSSRGIGKAIALTFASEGAKVVINYTKNKQLADEVVNQIEAIGQRAIAIKADISNNEQVEEMVRKTIDKFGSIDILINNAGTFKDSLIRKMKKDVWDEVIGVNLNGVFNCTKAVIDYMREQKWGRIINITSVQGQIGVIGASNYSASKAGVIGFTKSTAREVARKGITVNAISPGFIYTGMLRRLPQEIQDKILKQIPLGRFGKTEEMAQTVLFLSSGVGGYITGQVINVNGGYYM